MISVSKLAKLTKWYPMGAHRRHALWEEASKGRAIGLVI